MTTLNLDNLPEGMLTQIEQLAVKNNRSTQEQAIALLKQSLNQSQEKLKFLIVLIQQILDYQIARN